MKQVLDQNSYEVKGFTKTGIAPASVIIRNVTLYARAKENKLNYSNLYYLNSKH